MPARTTFPAWPEGVPTHPLLVVDYQLIKAGDEREIDRLWKAATELGFWYLKNHGVDDEVDEMFEMGSETMGLPLDEKMKYEQGDIGVSFGYKATGASATDETGNPDAVEFINVSQDDALAWPKQAHREYPSTVNARMESTIVPFVRKSLDINLTLISTFSTKLALPERMLSTRHSVEEYSGSEARCIKSPPRLPDTKAALGSHTDFGSLSILHNRLGGLQVMMPGSNDWQYVRPLPGHAICNVGDALSVFSGGILRSNMHRVVPPPKEQAELERWSLVFFTRPGNSVMLRALVDENRTIAEAAAQYPNKFETGSTAHEWFTRRTMNQRLNNRKGPETWRASRGMEHQPAIV
ncbi:Clavaminate synthase-like protein [Amylocystis lapponica]|nr:Clavaminate synthase-like protein [Amylocystis lapponica]